MGERDWGPKSGGSIYDRHGADERDNRIAELEAGLREIVKGTAVDSYVGRIARAAVPDEGGSEDERRVEARIAELDRQGNQARATWPIRRIETPYGPVYGTADTERKIRAALSDEGDR